ncbi:MAG: LacI family DNA-binding transcriptional regulator [Flavisolibacter sp.]|jgi:LacI family transcriptional regulator
MRNGKEVTIYDIAKRLNISPATVSRGLKDHPSISKKTKKKIFDLVDEVGYRSNHFARNLRQQQTNTIGVIVHELNSNFITSVLAGIEKVTTEAGYDLIIAHSSESVKKEAANAKNLFHKRVDGLIASLSFDTENLEHFQPFTDKGVPVIFFDRVEENDHHSFVIIDNARCGYLATKHLISEGCKRIAHVTSSLKRNVYAQRCRGYKEALIEAGLGFDESLVLVNDLSEKAGVDSAMQILQMNPVPDGIFITNDFVAAVCMRTLKENGIRIPEDIAVVGFNNDAVGKLVEPALTTIDYPGKDMGEIAARNLIDHIKGVSSFQQTNSIIVRSELVIRKSSLKKGDR